MPSLEKRRTLKYNYLSIEEILIVILLFIITFLGKGGVLIWSKALIHIFAFSIFLIWILKSIKEKGNLFSISFSVIPIEIFFFIYLILSVFNLFFSIYYEASFREFFHIISPILIYIVLSSILRKPNQLKNLAFFLILFPSLVGLYSIIIESPFVNKNHLALLLEMSIPLSVSYILVKQKAEHHKIKRIIFTISLIISIFALILTKSSGGILSLIISFIFFIFIFTIYTPNKANFIFIISILLILFILGLSIIWVYYQLPIFDSLNIKDRLSIWASTINIIKDYPLLGTGLDTFRLIFPRYKDISILHIVDYAHNDYLQFTAEHGILALIFFIIFGIFIFYKYISFLYCPYCPKLAWITLGSLTGLISVLFHELVDFSLHIPTNYIIFYLLLVLITGSIRCGKEGAYKFINLSFLKNFTLPILILFIPLWGFIIWFSMKPAIANFFYKRGIDFIEKEKDYEKGINNLKKAVYFYPKSSLYRKTFGNKLFELGIIKKEPQYIEEAKSQLETSFQINPFCSECFIDYSKLLCYNKDYKNCKIYSEKGLEIDPYNYVNRVKVAEAYLKTGEIEDGLFEYRVAIEINPKLLNKVLSQVYKNYSKEYNYLASLVPVTGKGYIKFANFLKSKNDTIGAISAFEKAIEIEPNDINNLITYADYLIYLKEFDKGLEILYKNDVNFPNNPYLKYYLGRFHFLKGTLKEAEKEFQEGLKYDSKFLDNLKYLVKVYCKMNDHEKSKSLLRKYLNNYSDNAELWFLLALCCTHTNEWSSAVNFTKKAIYYDLNNLNYRIFLANLYIEEKFYFEASRVLEEIKYFFTPNENINKQLEEIYKKFPTLKTIP